MFGDSTTAATASPTIRHALSIGGSELKTSKLQEVSEVPIPKGAVSNEYRKTRLLAKGCPKLLRLVEKHEIDLERSIRESQKLSQRLFNNHERNKLSIMSQRSNAIKPSKLSATLDERDAYTGFNTSKNAHVKHALFSTGKDMVSSMSPQPDKMAA